MYKKEIIKNFHRLRNIARKEAFMRENNIEFSCDEHNNYVVYAEDGTLQLFPV